MERKKIKEMTEEEKRELYRRYYYKRMAKKKENPFQTFDIVNMIEKIKRNIPIIALQHKKFETYFKIIDTLIDECNGGIEIPNVGETLEIEINKEEKSVKHGKQMKKGEEEIMNIILEEPRNKKR